MAGRKTRDRASVAPSATYSSRPQVGDLRGFTRTSKLDRLRTHLQRAWRDYWEEWRAAPRLISCATLLSSTTVAMYLASREEGGAALRPWEAPWWSWLVGAAFVLVVVLIRMPATRLKRQNREYEEKLSRLVSVFREVDWNRDMRWFRVEVATPFWAVVHEMWSSFAAREGITEDLRDILRAAGPAYGTNRDKRLARFAKSVYPGGCHTTHQFFERGEGMDAGVEWEDYRNFDEVRTLVKVYFDECQIHRKIGCEDYERFINDKLGKVHDGTGVMLSYLERRRHKALFGRAPDGSGADWYKLTCHLAQVRP